MTRRLIGKNMRIKTETSVGKLRILLRLSCGLWLSMLAALGATIGYGKIISMTPVALILFVLTEKPWIGWPVEAFVAGVPLTAIFLSVRSGWRKDYRSMAMFGSLPLVGAVCLFASLELSMPVFMRMLLNDYRQQIEQARQTGHDVDEREITIHLGPPLTARFQQPGMLFNELTFYFIDSDC